MANTVYDFALGEYVPEPDDRDPLLDQMKREEASLTMPISSGRMYMGPMLSPEEERAFLQKPSGTSINLMPPPAGPPLTQLENIQAASPPWATPISIRRDVPMPIPEDPGAARFALISEYQRMRAAGVPESEAVSRVGLDYFLPQGRYSRLTPYQELSTGLRERQLDLAEQAQRERLARESRREASYISPAVSARYKSLLSAEAKASDSMDAGAANRARWAREGFENEHPELISGPTVVTPPSTARSAVPKVGEVRKGYRFKGGNPNLKSSWEKVS